MRHVVPVTTAEFDDDLTSAIAVVGAYATPHGPMFGAGGRALAQALGLEPGAMDPVDPGFHADSGQSTRMALAGDGARVTLLMVGLGERAAVTADVLRAAAFRSARLLKSETFTSTLALELDDRAAAVRAVTEGIGLGDYRYSRGGGPSTASDDDRPVACLLIDARVDSGTVSENIVRGTVIAESANWVRQLVETPSNLLGPADLAAEIVAYAQAFTPDAFDISVWPADKLSHHGFGATLAVGAGSARPPCVVELRSRSKARGVGVAGKGITFDSGGINLKKDAGELGWMKSDMAGAAAVAAAIVASARLNECPAVHAILPLADNMPSGSAVRPGDVVVHPNGRTTEVVDTDCEGRLVLADAIAWLSGTNPTAIIDVGTLTDSGAVGTAMWGCWTNDPEFGAGLVSAGLGAGDPGWVLPLHASYRALFASPVADSRNAAADVPDSGQLAATFLEPFAGGCPWAHIDNGSGAYLEREFAEWPQGATGTPTRALIEYLGRLYRMSVDD
ncbi:MAG TPA: leucyl aminopeptidase family protein [Terrimesophilobacter sp.]|nr:leucyl aminopeptidase family protein [Terrimesophilobacter sp.]